MHPKNTKNIFNNIKNMWLEKRIYAFYKKKSNEKFNN